MVGSLFVQLTNSNIVGDSRLSTYTIMGYFANHRQPVSIKKNVFDLLKQFQLYLAMC